jgi:hypothetical protein
MKEEQLSLSNRRATVALPRVTAFTATVLSVSFSR